MAYCRMPGYWNWKEFMAFISQMRLGVGMGLIPDFRLEDVDTLMTAGQPRRNHEESRRHWMTVKSTLPGRYNKRCFG